MGRLPPSGLDRKITMVIMAGKASGLTYTQNEKGNFVDQSNRDTWKSTMDWQQAEENKQVVPMTHSLQPNNIFT